MPSFRISSLGATGCKTRATDTNIGARRACHLFLSLSHSSCRPQLTKSSNYRCGEHFPRGRLDSLTKHLTQACPGLSREQRLDALLALSGINHHGGITDQAQANGSSVDLPMIQRDWTALGVLAEVSRQIDLNEKNDDRGQPNGTAPPGTAHSGGQPAERFEQQDEFTMENPPLSQENGTDQAVKGVCR